MGTENKSEENEVKIEEKKNLLDNDTLRDLVNEKVDLLSLPADQQREFHERFVEGDEEGVMTVEEEAAAKVAEPETTVTPTDTPPQNLSDQTVNVEQGEPDVDKSALLLKIKDEKDANNTLRQRNESLISKLENLQNNKVPEPPKIEDALDENLTKQDVWNRKLATNLNNRADAEIQNIQENSADTKQKLLYSDVSLLQAENPELQTSKPIETLDKTYVVFRDRLVGEHATNDAKNEAVAKFFNDESFRKSKEAEGTLFPINDKDWKNYQTVSKLIGFKRNGGDSKWNSQTQGDRYLEMDTAYFKYQKENGLTPDPVQKAALDAATKVADQVAENQNQPNLLSPDVGKSSEGIDGITEDQASQWLLDHPTPTTPQEVATLQAILKKWSPSSPANNQPETVF